MKICLTFEGGIGQNLVATATLRAFREKYKHAEINVIATWPEIFKKNPHVNAIGKYGNDLHQSFVKDANIYCNKNLYREMAGTINNKHIVETFCMLHGMEYDGKGLTYQSTEEEEDKAKKFFKQFNTKKPKILIQPYSVGADKNWIHGHVQQLINKTCGDYQWIFVDSSNNSLPYNSFNLINAGIRDLVPLVKYCDGLVCIDSCLQHMAGGLFRKPSLMLMGRSKPELYAWPTTKTLSVPTSCEDFACERPEPHGHNDCLHHRCMYAITPEMVIDNMKEIICK